MTSLRPDELIVDLFAGGGGASEAIHQALGRHPDIALNHDADAVAVHARNHPTTHHLCQDVWQAEPVATCGGRSVGLLWASPDCRHFSRASGGRPKWKAVRSLPGVVLTWAKRVQPRVIVVENVREFLGWGPLLDDGTPCPRRIGHSFNAWVGRLRGLGYRVQWRELCAADFGAPTIRTRLFVVARRDDAPIAWPQPSHARLPSLLERPWRTAAECIDWSIPCPSIFDRPRPLKPATLRRIAEGVVRYVIKAQKPFIVRTGHWSHRSGLGFGFRGQGTDEPLATVATVNDKALVVPHVSSFYGTNLSGGAIDAPLGTVSAQGGHQALVAAALMTNTSGHPGAPVDQPLRTVCTGDHHYAVAAHLAPMTHQGPRRGRAMDEPVPTLTTAHRGEHALVAAYLAQHNLGMVGRRADDPISTLTTTGAQQQLVEARLSAEDEAGAAQVAAFLLAYYGRGAPGQPLDAPLGTMTTRDRYALVTVGAVRVPLVGIGMRMLAKHELQASQGFRADYDLTDGGRLSKTVTTRLIGNSVSPPPAAALLRVNLGDATAVREAA